MSKLNHNKINKKKLKREIEINKKIAKAKRSKHLNEIKSKNKALIELAKNTAKQLETLSDLEKIKIILGKK